MTAPAPGTPEWARLLTASKVAAILGLSPWESPRGAWLKMAGLLPHESIDNAATRRGHILEPAVLAWWEAMHPDGWIIEKQYPAFRTDMPRCLATLDALAQDTDELVAVEAKTTVHWDGWGEQGTDEIPTHYLVQACAQLVMCPTVKRVDVVALGPFLDFREYRVTRDTAPVAEIEDEMRRIVADLEAGVVPDLSDHPADFDAVLGMAPERVDKTSIEIPHNIADQYLTDLAHAARVKGSTARVLEAMGSAHYATLDGKRIARRTDRGLTRVAKLPNIEQDTP